MRMVDSRNLVGPFIWVFVACFCCHHSISAHKVLPSMRFRQQQHHHGTDGDNDNECSSRIKRRNNQNAIFRSCDVVIDVFHQVVLFLKRHVRTTTTFHNRCVIVIIITVLVCLQMNNTNDSYDYSDNNTQRQEQQSEEIESRSNLITKTPTTVDEQRRLYYSEACNEGNNNNNTSTNWFSVKLPEDSSNEENRKQKQKQQIYKCSFVFLDLGANIGDSLGKLINSGIPSTTDCNSSSTLQYDVQTGTTVLLSNEESKKNKLTKWSKQQMEEISKQVGGVNNNSNSSSSLYLARPEEYCYYGVEGNPMFTQRLQDIAHRVANTTPKPIRHAYYYTGTVATKVTGPTSLFLDTVNVKENYWGSSMFAQHQDVQRSVSMNGTITEIAVQGFTMTRILQQIVVAQPGSHVMIKIDIEGAEYGVLNEAKPFLCQLAESAVRVDILLETHPIEMIGGNGNADRDLYQKLTRHTLQQCGVHIVRGRDAG